MEFTEEHLRDPHEVPGYGAEMDFLEQFGTSSCKKSALRKQSFDLIFDPLLKDSPNNLVPVATETNRGHVTHKSSSGRLPEAKLAELDFLGPVDVPVTDPVWYVLGPVTLPLPVGPMVNVPQFTQEELKATQMKTRELKCKYKELVTECLEMEKIMDGFEGTVIQLMEVTQKQKELANTQFQKVLKEKDHLMTVQIFLDRSLSNLHKACEKQEEVIEGCRKNKEALLESIEDYVLRIEKAGQRYQALKAHTEEQYQLANQELAQARRQAHVEKLTFQVSLMKEQIRGDLLEEALKQTTAENEELTRIYEDLTSQVEKSALELSDQ